MKDGYAVVRLGSKAAALGVSKAKSCAVWEVSVIPRSLPESRITGSSCIWSIKGLDEVSEGVVGSESE